MRHKKLISIISSVLISVTMLLASSPIQAFADGTGTVAQQQKVAWAEQSIQSRISQINNQSLQLSNNTGAVNSMRIIVDSGIYLQLMSQQGDYGLQFSHSEYLQYYNMFMANIKAFNDYYSTGQGGSTKLTLPTTGLTDKSNLDMTTLFEQVANYLQQMCYKINGSTSVLSPAKLKTVASDNKTFLNAVNQFEDSIGTCVSSINNLIPNGKEFNIPISNFNNLIHTTALDKLLDAAHEENLSDVSNTGFNDINLTTSILNQFYKGSNHDNVQLSKDYYLLLACGAVYVPFESYVGGKYFQVALKKLANAQYDNIDKFYSQASQYMKPLYIKKIKMFSSTPAKRVTLRDFVNEVKNGDSFQLFLPKGVLQSNPTGTGYEYYTNLKNSEDNKTQASTKKSKDTKDKTTTTTKSSNSTSTENVTLQNNTQSIINMNALTPSVFNFGKYGPNGMSDNTIVTTNIVKNYASVPSNVLDSPLFMNAFGDIVTASGLEIIPACANSTLLAKKSPMYIYSTAFLGSYPSLSSRDLYFSVTNNRADGKYAVSLAGPSLNGKIYNSISGSKYGQSSTTAFYGEQINSSTTLSYSSNLQLNNPLQTNLSSKLNSESSLVNFRTYKFKGGLFDIRGGINNFFDSSMLSSGNSGTMYFLTKKIMNNASKGILAVLYSTPTTNLTSSQIGLLADNYYWYLMADSSGTIKAVPNGMMNNTLLSRVIVPCVLNGTNNPLSYANTATQSASAIGKTGWLHLYNDLCYGLSTVITSFTQIKGALGMMNAYNDPFLGLVMRYARQYFYILAAIALVGISIRYLKYQLNFLKLVIVVCFTGLVIYGFIFVLPISVPSTMNIVNDSISKPIAYKSLMLSTENYKALAQSVQSLKTNPKNELTPSITLYNLTPTQVTYYADQLGVNSLDLTDGTRRYLNSASGLFIQGNQLKQNLDVLFLNNPILGRYVQDGQDGITYKLFNMKMDNSNIDYYTPFYVIENSFVNKLNQFAQIYQLTRSQINLNGISKDSFIVCDFMKSPAFLSPSDYSGVAATTSPTTINKLKQVFPADGDFLGLSGMFSMSNKSEYNGVAQSLWYKTMKAQGLKVTSNQFAQIIKDVNVRTKEFMINNADNFKAMPDANIIRIISLYATCQFDKDISKFNMQVYPQNLNYQEVTVSQALYASVSNMNSAYMHPNYNIGQYIAGEYSIVGLFIYAFCAIFEAVIVAFTRFASPALYLLMCIVIVGKFLRDSEKGDFALGVIKASFIMLGCITANTFLYDVVYTFKGSFFTMFILLFGVYIIAEILTRLTILIVKNPGTFGNGQFNTLMPALLKVLRVDKIMNGLTVATTNIVRGGKRARDVRSNLPNRYSRYSRYNSVDDVYLSPDSKIYKDNFRSRRHSRKLHDDVDGGGNL